MQSNFFEGFKYESWGKRVQNPLKGIFLIIQEQYFLYLWNKMQYSSEFSIHEYFQAKNAMWIRRVKSEKEMFWMGALEQIGIGVIHQESQKMETLG